MPESHFDLPCKRTGAAENAVQWCRRRNIPAMQSGRSVRVELDDLSPSEAAEVVEVLAERYGERSIRG